MISDGYKHELNWELRWADNELADSYFSNDFNWFVNSVWCHIYDGLHLVPLEDFLCPLLREQLHKTLKETVWEKEGSDRVNLRVGLLLAGEKSSVVSWSLSMCACLAVLPAGTSLCAWGKSERDKQLLSKPLLYLFQLNLAIQVKQVVMLVQTAAWCGLC